MSDRTYGVFVYHEFTSDETPEDGKPFPGFPEDLHVVMVGPGETVVLAPAGSDARRIAETFQASS